MPSRLPLFSPLSLPRANKKKPSVRSSLAHVSHPPSLFSSPPLPYSDFSATEPRLLRAAVAAFLDLLSLATRTLEKFGHAPAPSA